MTSPTLRDPNRQAAATMTLQLPNGQVLTVQLSQMRRKLWKPASPLVAVGGGYVIFGWRGAALALLGWLIK